MTQEIVCHGHKHLDYGEGYVMLSRCKNIEQVFLDESFIPEKHLKVHPESLVEARKIEDNCIAAKLKAERFDIFFVHMRGKTNQKDVIEDPFAKQSSLVCLVQTGLNPGDIFQWPERRCLPDASSGNGKGVAVFTNDSYENLFKEKITKEEFQIVQVIIKYTFQVCIVYISPNSNREVFQDVANAINSMLISGYEPIIIGDFNFHAGDKNNPVSDYLKNTLNLNQIVTGPTYALGKNTIDHIYVSSHLKQLISVSHRFNYYTDHMSFNISLK